MPRGQSRDRRLDGNRRGWETQSVAAMRRDRISGGCLLAGLMAVLATLASVAPARSFAATESLVRDINPGTGDSTPYNLANLAGTLYFNAADPTHGAELWKAAP